MLAAHRRGHSRNHRRAMKMPNRIVPFLRLSPAPMWHLCRKIRAGAEVLCEVDHRCPGTCVLVRPKFVRAGGCTEHTRRYETQLRVSPAVTGGASHASPRASRLATPRATCHATRCATRHAPPHAPHTTPRAAPRAAPRATRHLTRQMPRHTLRHARWSIHAGPH